MMTTSKPTAEHAELTSLLAAVLEGQPPDDLEQHLMDKSQLPGPRMNLTLVSAFADVVGEAAHRPDWQCSALEALLDRWAALSLTEAPVNHPREILPSSAVLAYGQVAVSRPGWWDDEMAKI